MKSACNKFIRWVTTGQRPVWVQYSVLAIIILLPALLPGYIFTLDMVFSPHVSWPVEITSTYPLDALLWLLQHLLPGDVVQKIVLLAILVLAGAGMHLLVKELSPEKRVFGWQLAPYFAGVFYAINPFIYARLMAGQWLVLLGYALLPFLLRALFRLLTEPTWRRAAISALLAAAVVAVSVHFIGIVVVIFILFFIASIGKFWRQRAVLGRFARCLGAAGILTVVLSSYWLLPALFDSQNPISETSIRAGDAEFSAYATHSGPLGAVGEVLRLQGFWTEARQLFALPQEVMPLWGVLALLLWLLVIAGGVRAWKTNRPVAIVMIGSIVAGVILAASPLIQWLSQVVPLLGGYREPHKFAVLVVVGYAVLGGFGVAWLAGKRRGRHWAIGCLALPLLITPTMLWAGGGQLRPQDYPAQWYALNTRLKDIVDDGESVLFLPWHMYAPYSFTGERIIANPADVFFEVPVIISDDPEFAGVKPNQHNQTTQQIMELLHNRREVRDTLKANDIQYVVLAKEQAWREYRFLADELGTIYEDEKLILYEVKP